MKKLLLFRWVFCTAGVLLASALPLSQAVAPAPVLAYLFGLLVGTTTMLVGEWFWITLSGGEQRAKVKG